MQANSKKRENKMKIRILIALLILTGLSACTVVNYQRAQTHQATQLETREFQTRNFDTNDTKLIMKAMVNVLQDDGYIITNAVTELGVLMAKKEIDLSGGRNVSSGNQTNNDFWFEFFRALNNDNTRNNRNYQQENTYQKMKLVEVSINVTEFGKTSKVRANFQAKVLDNRGDVVQVAPVNDGKFYQDFFAKVDKSIFLQKQGL
jgi:hypothetical protein